MVRNWSERQIKDCIYNWNSILLHAYRGPIFASPCPLSMCTVQLFCDYILFWLYLVLIIYLGGKTIQRNVKFHACNFAAMSQDESIGRQLLFLLIFWFFIFIDICCDNFFALADSFFCIDFYWEDNYDDIKDSNICDNDPDICNDTDDDDQRTKALATFLLPCKVVQCPLDTQLRCLPALQPKEGEMLSVWAFFHISTWPFSQILLLF